MERLGRGNALVPRCLLAQDGQGPDVLVEGPKGVAEALASGLALSALLVSEEHPELAEGVPVPRGTPVYQVQARLFARLAGTVTPQGVLALVPRPRARLQDLDGRRLALVLDAIQDPKNVGALVRAAAAFGADGVIVGPGSAHPFSARAVRASAGAVFRVPVLERDAWAKDLRSLGYRMAVAEAQGGRDPSAFAWEGSWAVILGNEGHGSRTSGERRLTLQLARGVESLNVAVAGGVLLYAVRRRMSLSGRNGPW